MSRLDLLCVGEAFEDLIFLGLPRLPRPGEELRTARFTRTIGGGAVISAVAAARHGLRCGILSGLHGDAVRLLEREGVAVQNIKRPAEPHALSAAISTRRERAFVTFDAPNAALEPRLLRAVRRAARSRHPARHVHLALGPVNPARWIPVLRALRRRGITTSWDFGWNAPLARHAALPRLTRSIDYLFVNEAECKLYARRTTLAAALARWRALGANAVIKRGPRGARWVTPDLDVAAGAPRVAPVDTTGAGDVFNGVFLASVLRGYAPRACLRRAARAAARSTLHAGGIRTSNVATHTPGGTAAQRR